MYSIIMLSCCFVLEQTDFVKEQVCFCRAFWDEKEKEKNRDKGALEDRMKSSLASL